MRELLALGLTVVALGIFALVARSKRQGARALPPPPVQAEDFSEATASTPPSFEGARSAARAGTPREQRILDIEEREQTGRCLYCERPATRQVPQVMLVLSLFDRLYRKMNRVPANEWVIEVHPDVRHPHLLCDQHQPIARSYLEGHIAEEQASYAHYVEKQRRDMYEYISHGLDEKMLADANAIRGLDDKRGRRTKTLAANDTSNNVRTIGAAKAAS